MDTFARDLGYAVRTLIRMRAVAVVAILTLALGIGATTTMFSVVHALLLRPPLFADPDRLVTLFNTSITPRDGLQRLRWSMPNIVELDRLTTSFESLGSFTGPLFTLSGQGDPEHINGETVSRGYFLALRVNPIAGRLFTVDEDSIHGTEPVALIGERLWTRTFARDPAILGRSVVVNDVPLTVIGILPDGFGGLSGKAEIWIPPAMAARLYYADYLTTPQNFISVVARLKNGATLQEANAELAAIGPQLVGNDRTPGIVWGAVAVPLSEARIEPTARQSAVLLLAAAACVLVIACVNVASLLLARARVRRREIAVRLAIGSGRRRLVQLLLTEGLVMSAIAGACGTVLARWGIAVFALITPVMIANPRNNYGALGNFGAPALDVSVLMFALVVALGLLIENFAQLQRRRTGFVSDDVLTFWVRPPGSRYPPASGPATLDRPLARVQAVPGVESAAVNRCVPFAGCSRTRLFRPDRPTDPANAPVVGRHYTSSDYFLTLGIPIVAGRALTSADRAGSLPVAIVNESGARRLWPGESPLGKRVWFGTTTGPFSDPSHAAEIVGVAGDVKYEGADQADEPNRPEFYTSYLQFAFPDTMVIVKARGPATALVPAMRKAVAAIDPALPIYDVMTLDERIGAALSRPLFDTSLLAAFAAAALLLAAIGVYGMVSYSVSARMHDIGVRLALGADARRVMVHVLRESLRPAMVGVAIGIVASVALARVGRNVLPGVPAGDMRLLGSAGLVMLAVVVAATLVPARRAGAIDPVIVLRNE